MPDALHFLVLTVAGWVNRPKTIRLHISEKSIGASWPGGSVGPGVSVFGRVGPPSCHVCHDRWPARTVWGLDATCGAQTGGVRPPPPGSRAYRAPLRGGASYEAEG